MFKASINASEFNADLRRFARQFRQAMTRAVLSTAREGVEKIVQRTNEPPIPHAKKYQRTNRLISGWAPAGNYLGVNVPSAKAKASGSREGSYIAPSDTGDTISFTALNDVPYALFVELTGTWIIPPPNQVRRAPYLMVANTVKEMESADSFNRHIGNEWDALL